MKTLDLLDKSTSAKDMIGKTVIAIRAGVDLSSSKIHQILYLILFMKQQIGLI